MKLPTTVRGEGPITLARDASGVLRVEARGETDLYFGMGYAHALDRGLQMLLMRVLGRGQASEHLDSSDEMLAVDLFFRRMNWAGHLDAQLDALPGRVRACAEAYAAGANARFERKRPWELRLVGYRPPPWTVADSVILSRMVGYLTLAQSQHELERLLVELVQAGVERAALEELFPAGLEGLDLELVRRVKLGERIVPEALRWSSVIPRMMASNNWVVSPRRTVSGRPLLANDPHLETNRLPNVWQEVVLRLGDRWAIGATMPGLPGILVGRTPDLAWGATYTFMDAIDSWVEHCRDGCYRRGDEWLPFARRPEVIRRKKKPPHEVVFSENEHGVLDGDPQVEGYYLATRWASSRSGAASLGSIAAMWEAANVAEGMEHLGRIETSFNWVLADTQGNIGYQMSGLMPRRRPGVRGLVPLPGWEPENDWQGFVAHSDLPRCINPEAGYFVTANHDLNEHGRASPINAPMGPHRARRIAALLEEKGQIAVEDNFAIQYDTYSLQAEGLMRVLEPLLPDTPQGRLLRDWDRRYEPESQGAFLFEQVYRALLRGVFGERGVGLEVFDHLLEQSGVVVDFADNFDRVLRSDRSRWFGGEERDELYRRLIAAALEVEPQPWGSCQQLVLTNIFFAGKLPRWLGFDRGPITLRGGRATPHQGQIYRSGGRQTSFAPSFRMVTDLGSDEVHTNLAGGPSDRRFSKWYCSDLESWLEGRYKVLRP